VVGAGGRGLSSPEVVVEGDKARRMKEAWPLACQAPHQGGSGPRSEASSWTRAGPHSLEVSRSYLFDLTLLSLALSFSLLSESRPVPPLSSWCHHLKWLRTQKLDLRLRFKLFSPSELHIPSHQRASLSAQGKGPHHSTGPLLPLRRGRIS
jgi:hypothetical protein